MFLLACVYEGQLLDKLHLLYCGIIRTSTLPTCMTHTHTWEQWTRCSESRSERTMSDESITECEIVMRERSWSACSWLLYCSMQRVMFRPCTHMSAHVHMVQSESDMIEYVSPRDWPYVMSRQNNQTERDQLMVNSLLYEWCTFPWLYFYMIQIKQSFYTDLSSIFSVH